MRRVNRKHLRETYVSYKTYNMNRLTASDAREHMPDTLNRVAFGGERFVIHRRGKDLAALVPLEDLELLRALEDELDVAAARDALKEGGAVPWDELKAKLGL